jgi:hypothetical protein
MTQNDSKGDDMTIKVLAGITSLGTILILGGYGYTWSESKLEQTEKREWRQEHQKGLDKRFEEIKIGQEKLAERIDRGSNATQDMLQRILDEQRRLSDNLKTSSKNK